MTFSIGLVLDESPPFLWNIVTHFREKHECVPTPHVTIIDIPETEWNETRQQNAGLHLAKKVTPLVLTATKISTHHKFFEAISLDIQETPGVTQVRESLAGMFGIKANVSPLHLSLLYTNLENDSKQRIVDELRLPPFPMDLRFSRVDVTKVDETIKDPVQEFHAWTRAATFPLGLGKGEWT